jgi:predicted lipoprotein with Yx(FWY)xxD motif
MAIRQITTAAATAALMMLAGAGLAAPDLTEVTIGGAKALADARGMTLYTFDKDKAGASACYDGCATKWPPALAPDGAKAKGDYGVTERKDNTYQWTYRSMPLYTYYEDKAAGDATGDGMGGVWHIARP